MQVDTRLLIALLPAVFMLHDFEEIIMFRPWLDKNRTEIAQRFPRLDRLLRRYHDKLSTSAFAVGVLHEFTILSAITYVSLHANSYRWWFAVFMAFALHLLVHVAQWVAFGRYVPFIITSIAALPYCCYTFLQFSASTVMTWIQMTQWTIIGVVLTVLSFGSAFALASAFERWKTRTYLRQ
jgi:hypothetical protein